MKTINLGMKEFRANMAKWTSEASKKNQKIIIFRNKTPMFEFRVLTKREQEEAEFEAAMERAEDDIRNGRVYTDAEVMARIKERLKMKK